MMILKFTNTDSMRSFYPSGIPMFGQKEIVTSLMSQNTFDYVIPKLYETKNPTLRQVTF